MEPSIPLEQLAITCRTLHDARVLTLHNEKETAIREMTPNVTYDQKLDTIIISHPYGETVFVAHSDQPEIFDGYKELLNAIETNKNFVMDTPSNSIEKLSDVFNGFVRIIHRSEAETLIKPSALTGALNALITSHN